MHYRWVNIIRICAVAGIFLLAFPGRAVAADYIKTVDHFIGSSDATLSTATNTPFVLYIGDDLSGIATPMKSLYFTISGVYTGGGTVAFSINSDAATQKVFTLPIAVAPTPFEILYRDTTNKINPTSAGSFAYTLRTVPSGVSLYGFAAALTETHQYKPPACPDGSSTKEKLKSLVHFVGSSDATLSTATNTPFVLYIGDDLSGIATPMKSLYFTISGVYTGGGTVAFSINSDAATQKVFTLPIAVAPTPFEILYRDTTNKINPTSAGSFAYTLRTVPSGVSLYGFAAALTETHQYKPPACAGMPISGELLSVVFDTTGSADGPAYNSILWKGTMGAGMGAGKVRFQLAASDNILGPWNFIGGTTCSFGDWFDPGGPDTAIEIKGVDCFTQFNNKRYFRYKVQICSLNCTDSGNSTPQVADIIVSWSP